MENEEGPNLYERFDNQLMKGANASVRAWNWTTGKTKADLANVFLILNPVLKTTSLALAEDRGFAVLLGAVETAYGLIFMDWFKKWKKERKKH